WNWYLVLIGDLFAIAFIWMWLTIFRGHEIKNYFATVTEILAACAVIIPVDLFLAYQYPPWKLLPSAILNILILGIALVACIIRYKKRGIPLVIAMTAYSLAKVPAYGYAASGISGPEMWLYYSLGACEVIIFMLLLVLLLFPNQRDNNTKIKLFNP